MYKVIQSYYNNVEANRAKSLLEEAGIECFLSDENVTNLYPMISSPFGGIKLHVQEKDMEKARRVLDVMF